MKATAQRILNEMEDAGYMESWEFAGKKYYRVIAVPSGRRMTKKYREEVGRFTHDLVTLGRLAVSVNGVSHLNVQRDHKMGGLVYSLEG